MACEDKADTIKALLMAAALYLRMGHYGDVGIISTWASLSYATQLNAQQIHRPFSASFHPFFFLKSKLFFLPHVVVHNIYTSSTYTLSRNSRTTKLSRSVSFYHESYAVHERESIYALLFCSGPTTCSTPFFSRYRVIIGDLNIQHLGL